MVLNYLIKYYLRADGGMVDAAHSKCADLNREGSSPFLLIWVYRMKNF